MFSKKLFKLPKINLRNSRKFNPLDLVFAFFVVTRLIALFFSFPCVTDVPNYLALFSKIKIGLIPYLQVPFEYPPLTLIPIYFPRLFGAFDFASYYLSFAFFLFIVDFLLLCLCKNYCKNNLKMTDKETYYMTLLYSLFGLLLFRILYHRLDLVVALFFVTSLVFFDSKSSQLKKIQFSSNQQIFHY